MSFSSYDRLPSISSYISAKQRLVTTVPIRGSVPVRVPLADRANSTQFALRMVGDDNSLPDPEIYKSVPGAQPEDIELLLYRQPVITFHKPADPQTPSAPAPLPELSIFCGTWARWSAADCWFINSVLDRYFKATTRQGRLILTSNQSGARYTVPKKGHIRFQYDEETRRVAPISNEPPTTLRLNRKAANTVRARYGEFYRYVKGLVGVRKEVREFRWYSYQAQEEVIDQVYQLHIKYDEWAKVVPQVHKPVHGPGSKTYLGTPDFYLNNNPLRKPAKQHEHRTYENGSVKTNYTNKPYKDWLMVTKRLTNMISTPADDPDQHETFYQAFIWLAFYIATLSDPRRLNMDIELDVTDPARFLDELVFKRHSEEVFERVPAKHGAIPNLKYEAWMTRERDE